MNKISELRPFQKKVELIVKVLEKNEIREVTSKLDNSSHKVTEALVGDDSGVILLTLWDDMIDRVELDKAYSVNNAYTSLFKNTLRLNIGRYGELTDSEEDVAEINKDNNLSEKEFEQRGRRFGGDRGGARRDFSRSDSQASDSSDASSDSSEAKSDDSAEASETKEEPKAEEAKSEEAPAEDSKDESDDKKE